MLEFNGTFIVMIFSFLAFMAIMQKIFYAPVAEIRKNRQDYIDGNLQTADNHKEASEALLDEYNNKIKQAKSKAGSIIVEQTENANKKKASILEDASNKLSSELNSSREALNRDIENTKEGLKSQVISLAQQISSKILGEEVSISGVNYELIDKNLNR